MEYIIGFIIVAIIIGAFNSSSSGNKKSGGCKYCGGELKPTHSKHYSFKCWDCGTEYP